MPDTEPPSKEVAEATEVPSRGDQDSAPALRVLTVYWGPRPLPEASLAASRRL